MKNFYGFADRSEGVAQAAVLLDARLHQDGGQLGGDESFLRKRIDVPHDRILCVANSIADRGITRPALVGAAVFKAAEVNVDRDLARIQSEREDIVRHREIVFVGELIHKYRRGRL